MRVEIAKERKSNVSQLAASKRFGKYKKESEEVVRKAHVEMDPILEQLMDVWTSTTCLEIREGWEIRSNYEAACKSIKGLSYSANDIEKFTLALSALQDEEHFHHKVGIFLSALINNGEDRDYIVHTSHLKLISYLGYSNSKNIIVKGDSNGAGEIMSGGSIIVDGNIHGILGKRMKGGMITVNGNTACDVGDEMEDGTIIINGGTGNGPLPFRSGIGFFMKGGLIIVKNGCRFKVGSHMSGGRIIVMGEVEDAVGDKMKGGEIHIHGNFKSLGNVRSGKIFHKGKLIVDK